MDQNTIPHWLTTLSIAMLLLGGLCAAVMAIDLMRGNKQQMWIMNIVWPTTALFGILIAVCGYFRYGRLATRKSVMEARERGEEPPNKKFTPFPMMVAKGATHCGSGCTLGDIAAELLALSVPAVAVWFDWNSLFPADHNGKIFAVWVLSYLFAFLFGIGSFVRASRRRCDTTGSALGWEKAHYQRPAQDAGSAGAEPIALGQCEAMGTFRFTPCRVVGGAYR